MLTNEQIEKAKQVSKELSKDPDIPEEKDIRMAEISDIIVDKTKTNTAVIIGENGPCKIEFRKLTFKETGLARKQAMTTTIDPKDPKNPKIEIDQDLYAKYLLSYALVYPDLTFEQVEQADDDTVSEMLEAVQKTKIKNFMKLKNSQSPMKQE